MNRTQFIHLLTEDISGLVSFWDFQANDFGHVAKGPCNYVLHPNGGRVPLVEDRENPIGPLAAQFGSGAWLDIPRSECPRLNIHGSQASLSIIAWIKRETGPERGCEAISGMWNEHGLRQYCLFLNLGIHNSSQQVGAHVSSIGGPTPGARYCMDAAIGSTAVPFGEWQFVAMTYDGVYAAAYLNGQLDSRGERNPYHYPGGIFDGGKEGANFTVGAVARPERVVMRDGHPIEEGHVHANLFHGLVGGLAVFERALVPSEIAEIFRASMPYSQIVNRPRQQEVVANSAACR
ncbi:concanavalin A-like lectin/glucanases superfamily protein [Terrimicrobium sacchariphilum]|jgi:hypothetical protein|uniref:Concanavalin A-like lectin/glucanases superfamily protein n=1 Tax=Terrimicrobium sacchariphilum TaxID=690879 RepID=A0A146GFN1_TERSA|nr:LamG-like jellyroll fold domain-containing protein [Terrimicrobium sacchariphilum]GAT35258.1 concanavalin A-like lectin/glucanases superfamily protein [Terrimicrobium sacchariphilum]